MDQDFDYDVFISYSSQDKAIVHPLAERLRDDGVKVWLDAWALKPGDPIGIKIQHGLENSRVLLMCMSKAYFASDWATLEHHTLLFHDPIKSTCIDRMRTCTAVNADIVVQRSLLIQRICK